MFIGLMTLLLKPGLLFAQAASVPTFQVALSAAENPDDVVGVLKILAMLTVLTLAPAILIMMTSFTRIIIVLSFLRTALGLQQVPPTQLLIGLALFLTLFVMSPFFGEIKTHALDPYLAGKMNQEQALEQALRPIRRFMFHQTREDDLGLFIGMSQTPAPKVRADVPTAVLVPSFILSELRTAFQIGFIIYIPFLIIDLVTASVLMAMGMMMLPPVVVSMPIKIMLFVLVDGWALIVGSMVRSFG